jgi:hypothetical protein
MRTVSKLALTSVAALLVAALAPGCGGYSQEDAVAYCEVERDSKAACYNDTSYNACVDCFAECGSECVALATCPATYTCP